jgi:hypothetical protein
MRSMSKGPVRWTAFVLAVAITVATHNAFADTPRVRVRVYDYARVDPAKREAAIGIARRIISEAGTTTDWEDCSSPIRPDGCKSSRRAPDLILRLALTPPNDAHPIVEVVRHSQPIQRRIPLGVAVIDPATGTGVMATIYIDRVLALGKQLRVATDTFLGRTMAHEIGHLLLGRAGHDPAGLMREEWTDAEMLANRKEDWLVMSAALERGRRRAPLE